MKRIFKILVLYFKHKLWLLARLIKENSKWNAYYVNKLFQNMLLGESMVKQTIVVSKKCFQVELLLWNFKKIPNSQSLTNLDHL